ncbi:hypothetical protein BKA93DRAFT_891882 [Sparassis latifolia]
MRRDAHLPKSSVWSALFRDTDNVLADETAHWTRPRLLFLFKNHITEDDPFESEPAGYSSSAPLESASTEDKAEDSFELTKISTAARGAATRGQIISGAKMLFSRQHRCFAFTILLLRDFARIIRWDRAGAISTNRFQYTNTEYLAKFMWRFCNMTDKQQGYDTTAVAVEPGSVDYKLMRQVAQNPPKGAGSEYARQSFAKSMPDFSKESPDDWSCWKLTIHPEEGKATDGSHSQTPGMNKPRSLHFLVGKPHFRASGLTGRATRGYIAYNYQDEKFVFLKDVWRVDLPDIEKEGNIIQSLNKAKVENVPTVVCHGDVIEVVEGQVVHLEQQRTKTAAYLRGSYSGGQMNPIKTYTHYRLVVEEICRPLKHFENTVELTRMIADGINAHQQALEKVGIIHLDVSAGNILINETLIPFDGELHLWRVGMLCDWELAKSIDYEVTKKEVVDETRGYSKKAPQLPHAGTWQFMSAILLDSPSRPVEVADELEAFFNVFLFHLIKFTNSSIDKPAYFITQYFDECNASNRGTHYACGTAKRNAMQSGMLQITMYQTVKFFYNDGKTLHPCNNLVGEILGWFKARYAHLSPDDWLHGTATLNDQSQAAEDHSEGAAVRNNVAISVADHMRQQIIAGRGSEFATRESQERTPDFNRKIREMSRPFAENLKTHGPMYRLFMNVFLKHADEWPKRDKVPNRLLSDDCPPYEEKRVERPVATVVLPGSKRQPGADLQRSRQSKRCKIS